MRRSGLTPTQPSPTHVPLPPSPRTKHVSPVTIILQEKCFLHKYIRERDASGIVERPERLRAVSIGLAAAIARLEDEVPPSLPREPDDLTRAMSQMSIAHSSITISPQICQIIHSDAILDLVSHPAMKYIHANATTPEANYLTKLKSWAAQSEEKIQNGTSEIPNDLAQGDLYLCPGSYEAIAGAAASVCQGVDRVVEGFSKRAFVVIRPPGHHCGEDTPSGFCFINNIAVGAAHAYLEHGIDRVVILDIDLHHGNGTQKIAWAINEATHRQELENRRTGKRGMKMFYGSIHDILSYPCEDGDPLLIRDASVSLHNAHGQFIENIHLQPYASEEEFHNVLYQETYSILLTKARHFLQNTDSTPSKTLFMISCGFDACEHEYSSMSRHDRKVPVSFYERFAADVSLLAADLAEGKVISVLEGGYSDRALISGAMAHLTGLAESPTRAYEASSWDLANHRDWWAISNIVKVEAATKKARRTKAPTRANQLPSDKWLARTLDIFSTLDCSPSSPSPKTRAQSIAPIGPTMSLRTRSKKPDPNDVNSEDVDTTPVPSTQPSPTRTASTTRRSGVKSAQTTPVSKPRPTAVKEEVDRPLPADRPVNPKGRRKSAHGVLSHSTGSTASSPSAPQLIPPLPPLPLFIPKASAGDSDSEVSKEPNEKQMKDMQTLKSEEARAPTTSTTPLLDPQQSLKIRIKLPIRASVPASSSTTSTQPPHS